MDAIIMAVCLMRLAHYVHLGVMRPFQIKTAFHICLLLFCCLTLPFSTFCDVNYDIWQCDVGSDDPRYDISWAYYALRRLASPLLLICLSMMIYSWASFLRETDNMRASMAPVSSRGNASEAQYLKVALVLINLVCTVSAIVYAISLFSPDKGDSENVNRNDQKEDFSIGTYMNWMIDGCISLLLILVTLGFGLRLQSRIANTNIFNQQDRFAILVRLNTTLAIMTVCAICGVYMSFVNCVPFIFNSKSGLGYRYLQHHQVTFTVLNELIPRGGMTFSLLYLMRTPPAPPPPETSAPTYGHYAALEDDDDKESRYSHSINSESPNYHPGGAIAGRKAGVPKSMRSPSTEWRQQNGGFESV